MQTIVVIPTYNERDNIVNLINDIFLQPIENLSIIIVDENSPDKTAELVSPLQTAYPNL